MVELQNCNIWVCAFDIDKTQLADLPAHTIRPSKRSIARVNHPSGNPTQTKILPHLCLHGTPARYAATAGPLVATPHF